MASSLLINCNVIKITWPQSKMGRIVVSSRTCLSEWVKDASLGENPVARAPQPDVQFHRSVTRRPQSGLQCVVL